ncbi:hypothetical protein PLESTB_000161700 [Pleodorina starrii]|uniref:Biogenesis of lysosome-related organelles complex 1 subunit 7 n=1 Tax=Pleodorina starrii TaxID=330485 RepID=A0A9W6BC27_9CHLO|nr:hypothetical protein PLESTB_000161700 [Pleodorina starrii]GLC72636.1 hypothetical protein PLESTF_001273100 [Pleodorina starrii]
MLRPGGVVDSQFASSVVKAECRGILKRQQGLAEHVYDELAASQAQLSQELQRLRAALDELRQAEPLALTPDHATTLSRIQRKIGDLSRRLGVVEARVGRIKGHIKAASR